MLRPGIEAPDFVLPDQNGEMVKLSDLRGEWIALWWYPKAASPTCTLQGKGFCSAESDYAAAGARVLGISFDSVEENRDFASTHHFGFPLLSDESRSIGEMYGVVRNPDDDEHGDKALRISYIIDPQGRISRAYEVRPEDAADDSARLLEQIKALAAADESASA